MCKKRFINGILLVLLLSSCSSVKNVVYFQELEPGRVEKIASQEEIRIKPGDKISIIVNSKDPQLAGLFNLRRADVSSGGSRQLGYTVNAAGAINFPVLGEVYIAGMSREQIAVHIREALVTNDLIKDPVVIVDFLNLTASVLGEVGSPGSYNLERDKTTILELLSMAGDLTIHGKRENVTVLREKNGKQHCFQVDLRSAEDLYASPAYYVQQGDVVYVEPNAMRARQSSVNGNNILTVPFWMSFASFVTTMVFIFVK